MILRRLLGIIFLFSFIISCENAKDDNSKNDVAQNLPNVETKNAVIDSIIKRKKLRAVTDYGSVSYLIYRGEPVGYQYELLSSLTKQLNVDLELIMEGDMNKSIEMLNNEEVDLIAMGLTITSERSKQFSFTLPIMTTRQVLVQRKPVGYQKMATADEIESHLLRNTLDLANKTIHVQKGTIFSKRLQTLSNEIGDTIIIVNDDREIEDLIAAVASGEIDYTVADEHVALVNAKYYNNIDAKTPLSFPQKIAWAAKLGQTGLTDTINSWLIGFNKSLQSRLLYNKYFKNIRSKKIAKSAYNSYSGNQLSPFDDEIKEAAVIIGWDWRLLASLVYQESEFKPNVRSWVGAYGLMQLMPSVLKKYNLDSTSVDPAKQLIAGAKHLKYINNQLPDEISDSIERIKFLMASYNCGIGHVFDARRLAKKYNKDNNKWTYSVDSCILNLSEEHCYRDSVVFYGYVRGKETFNFVEEIMKRYDIYKNLIKE